MTEVTCGDFAALARRRGWKLAFLTEQFRGKIDKAADFFGYALQGQYAATVIPFNSVLVFYGQERGLLAMDHSGRTCKCGCKLPVFDRKQWATAGCRKRAQRDQSRTRVLERKSA